MFGKLLFSRYQLRVLMYRSIILYAHSLLVYLHLYVKMENYRGKQVTINRTSVFSPPSTQLDRWGEGRGSREGVGERLPGPTSVEGVPLLLILSPRLGEESLKFKRYRKLKYQLK